jgi:ElaB/YqjD/DUF883 family membrane-anchored ribosome-binding protein
LHATTKETAVAQAFPDTEFHQRSKPMSETATDLGTRAWEQTTAVAVAARDTVREHPVATAAVIAGLAFAVGALWKIGQGRQQTRAESLLARLSDLQGELPRRWRM